MVRNDHLIGTRGPSHSRPSDPDDAVDADALGEEGLLPLDCDSGADSATGRLRAFNFTTLFFPGTFLMRSGAIPTILSVLRGG
jgi:hypothetical protein